MVESGCRGSCCDREGRRDEGTSVVAEGATEEEVAAAETTEQGASAVEGVAMAARKDGNGCPTMIKKRRAWLW
ncbi:hypothetical protein GW17_00000228 [Ensete ventricosum]|nr:hypothetical protein GW17_00000228 [Ensete ventricosum]RZS15894.1 hypothetical protein BHM03_00047800 [Ensete ventricosum]